MLSPLIRLLMRSAHQAQLLISRVTRRRPDGVHGVVLTSAGEVVLVRLTYADGWHLPGGGRKRGETPKEGLLRELREEIGLRAWSSIETLGERTRVTDGCREHDTLFLIRGAVHRPHWSLEISQVEAFKRSELPADVTPWTRAALVQAGFQP